MCADIRIIKAPQEVNQHKKGSGALLLYVCTVRRRRKEESREAERNENEAKHFDENHLLRERR